MRSFYLLLLLVASFSAYSQNCDCASQFDFVKQYYEANNPAYQKLVQNDKEVRHYREEIEKIRKEAAKTGSIASCGLLLEKYISLLKDHHSSLGYNLKRVDFKTEEDFTRFKASADYKNYPILEIDTAALFQSLSGKPLNDLEGIYTNGGTLVFGVLKKQGAANAYQGIVLRKTALLEPGHVILDLEQESDGYTSSTYHIGLLGFNFPTINRQIRIKNGQIPDFGFYKINSGTLEMPAPYAFTKLNDSTNYLRLSSFDGALSKELDSLYQQIDTALSTTPYLIIDIRDNGGGDEKGYFNLMPFLYTRPMKIDSVLVWVSPENILHYEESGGNEELIARMKAAKSFTFIPRVKDRMAEWVMDSIATYPKKVALLFNKGTASSAESMITYSMQSDKVITIGENSGGYLGFGDVKTIQVLCGHFHLNSTVTMYHKNAQYEFVGIEPMYPAQKNTDWIKYAQSLLTK